MFRIAKYSLLVAMVLFFTWFSLADEGMWMPHQMTELDLTSQGLEMDPGNLYKEDGTGLMNALVSFGGASGGFVSKKGLIITNHHVAFRAIQRASDKEHDYITNGFIAGTLADEIPASGYYADVLLGYQDVTQIVLKQLKPGMTPEQSYKALERIEKKLVANAEKKGKDLNCAFKSIYSGNKYYLFTFKRLWDVRIVYAPPNAIGNYGGEVDNWMWPRHTCDFTFLRAYVSKDNQGVPYSIDNVPYEPKSVLKISQQGVKENDFTFIMGYPGRTQRNYAFAEFQFEVDEMKQSVEFFKAALDFFEEAGKNDRSIQIKYASMVKSLNNILKNLMGKLEGFQKHSIADRKKSFEEKVLQWIEQEPQRKRKYGSALLDLEKLLQDNVDSYQKKRQMDSLLNTRSGPALLSQAHLIYRTVTENQKPDMQREQGFQERDLQDIRIKIEVAERGYYPEIDKAYLKFWLKRLKDQDKSRWPRALISIFEKGPQEIDAFVNALFASTILKDPKKRLELIIKKPADLLRLNDPLIKLAADLETELTILREQEKIYKQKKNDLKKVYLAALLEMARGRIAPDANSSIRFTCGQVKQYHPRDGVIYLAQTALQGIMEKETGIFPFEVPPKLKELYQARDFGTYIDNNLEDISTCFINTTNVTGGSSGSPTFNARGEIIGIAFDMVYESVICDYFIIPEFQRVINVDIRYVLFITDKFSGATHLLKEMGL